MIENFDSCPSALLRLGLAFGFTFSVAFSALAQTPIKLDLGKRTCVDYLSAPPFEPDLVHDEVRALNDFWRAQFNYKGWNFIAARIQILTTDIESPCGMAGMESGPVYCGLNRTIYLNLFWFYRARTMLGMESKIFLKLVLAHEFGHHIQALREAKERGLNYAQLLLGPGGQDYFYPRFEYQADCLAGIYFRSLHDEGAIADRDVVEALQRVFSLGDDIQAEVAEQRGLVLPPQPYSHGTARNRTYWAGKGMDSYSLEACETFYVPLLN